MLRIRTLIILCILVSVVIAFVDAKATKPKKQQPQHNNNHNNNKPKPSHVRTTGQVVIQSIFSNSDCTGTSVNRTLSSGTCYGGGSASVMASCIGNNQVLASVYTSSSCSGRNASNTVTPGVCNSGTIYTCASTNELPTVPVSGGFIVMKISDNDACAGSPSQVLSVPVGHCKSEGNESSFLGFCGYGIIHIFAYQTAGCSGPSTLISVPDSYCASGVQVHCSTIDPASEAVYFRSYSNADTCSGNITAEIAFNPGQCTLLQNNHYAVASCSHNTSYFEVYNNSNCTGKASRMNVPSSVCNNGVQITCPSAASHKAKSSKATHTMI